MDDLKLYSELTKEEKKGLKKEFYQLKSNKVMMISLLVMAACCLVMVVSAIIIWVTQGFDAPNAMPVGAGSIAMCLLVFSISHEMKYNEWLRIEKNIKKKLQ